MEDNSIENDHNIAKGAEISRINFLKARGTSIGWGKKEKVFTSNNPTFIHPVI